REVRARGTRGHRRPQPRVPLGEAARQGRGRDAAVRHPLPGGAGQRLRDLEPMGRARLADDAAGGPAGCGPLSPHRRGRVRRDRSGDPSPHRRPELIRASATECEPGGRPGMLIRRAPRFTANDVTDETLYWNRREWIAAAAATLALLPGEGVAAAPAGPPLKAARNEGLSLKEPTTKFDAATTYNNFYEFGVNKDDPARLAHTLRPRPWAVQVDGLVQKPKTFDVDE